MKRNRVKGLQRALVFLFLFALQFNAVAALCLDHFIGEKMRVYHGLLSEPHPRTHDHHDTADNPTNEQQASGHECHLAAASALPATTGDSLITPFKEGATPMPFSLALPQNVNAALEESTFLLRQLSYPPPDRPPRR